MTVSSTPFIPGIINLRDVGGYPTAEGGHVAKGRLYRSGQLNFEDAAGRAAFASLGVTTVLTSAARMNVDRDRIACPLASINIT